MEGFEEILLKEGPIGAGDAIALYDLPATTQEAFAAGWNRRHDLAAMTPAPKPNLSAELKAAVARLIQDVKSILKGELAFTALAGHVGEVERLSDDKTPAPQAGETPRFTVDWIQSNAGLALERLLELEASAKAPIKLVVTVDAAAVVRIQGTHAIEVVVLDSELDGAEDEDIYAFENVDGSTKYYVYGAGTAEIYPDFVADVHGLFLAKPDEVDDMAEQGQLSNPKG